jgi:hypothetical protein
VLGQRHVVAVLAPPPPPHVRSLSSPSRAPSTCRLPAARNWNGASRAQPRGF